MLRKLPLTALAATLVALLASAAPAAARFDDRPVRFWSFSEVRQGAGKVRVAAGSQQGGLLRKHFDFGGAAFNFPESAPRGRATGTVFSSASGQQYAVLAQAPSFNGFQPGSAKGATAHLDELRAYEKRSGKARLSITLSKAFVDAIDANHGLLPSECPPRLDCNPIRGIVRFHARAYASSAGGDFFNAGGVAYIEGHEGRWTIDAVTSSDSRRPLWDAANFAIDDDVDDLGTRSHAVAELKRPLTVKVPLTSVREGELFGVHVTLDAETVDSRGRESAVEAFIRDPQKLEPALVTTKGVRARGAPKFREPAVKRLPAARCGAGRHRRAGTLALDAPAYGTDESTGVPVFVRVTRRGGKRGRVSAKVTTRAGSAEAGRDYRKTTTTVAFRDRDASPRLVELPILEDQEAEAPQTFTVSLSGARCAKLGKRRSAPVTIADDDTPPVQPPAFTVGGTVDGLQGSGLVLGDFGSELTVAGNGPFTLPGTRADGLSYDVKVRTQPRSPDQTCTVTHGTGTIHGANVGDIAVHCVTPALPPGLDPTFGGDGRVSTPVGAGKAEAVLLQADGGIITAGRRATGTATGIDFALTRHDARGNLDLGFGAAGIVTTDLGSQTDEALDAAPYPGGFVVVGRTEGSGVLNRDFGVVRYTGDGAPDARFGGDGIVATDFAGSSDQANSVAVQPDGKIVVAGLANTGGLVSPDGDVALARYKTDGTLDSSFGGGDGLVTTDLGTTSDAGRDVAIQPGDGKIVVAGTADSDVALARYTTEGELDTTFGSAGSGIRVTDFGSDDFANGVALTADGHILVAGHTLGAALDLDFALARYTSTGGLDRTFGTGGITKTNLGSGDDFGENLAVQTDGRIVVAGRASSSTILDMALVRYGADGRLDPSFAGDGVLTADFHGKGEFGQDVVIQPDGRIVAAGYTGNGTDTEFALIRANP